MTVDARALWETYDVVVDKARQGVHDQGRYIARDKKCGTVACFVGWRAIMDGAEILSDLGDVILPDGTCIGMLPACVSKVEWPPGTIRWSWTAWGAHRFGITRKQARVLFNGENDLDDLRRLIKRICRGETLAQRLKFEGALR